MKNSVRFAAACILLLCSQAQADEVDKHVMQGIDQLYSVRFDDAARSFEKAIAADRGDPRGYFYRANVHLWSYIFDKRPAQLDLFLKLSDQGIAVAEKKISANPRDSRSRLFLGMIYGYKAIANARADNFMAAALSARVCYAKLNEVVRDDPRAYDAYLGLGIFHFLIGSVPKAAQFMAGVGGMKGDAKLGVKEIETVAKQGTYFRNDAQLILALLNVYYLEETAKGLGELEKIAARYPNNVAILYAMATTYLNEEQPDKAIGYYERVIKQGNNDFKVFTTLSYGRCGIAYFAKNDVARAKPHLQKFIKNSDEKMYRAHAWYLLGLCFEMEGSRANALKAYEYVEKSPTYSSPEDRVAHRKAKILQKAPPTVTDLEVIRALNSVSAGNFNDARDRAGRIIAQKNITPAQRAQASFALGRALQARGDYKGALDAYRNAIAVRGHNETWVAPYSYFHTAESYLKLGDREKWRANIDLAKSISDYDNEPQLRFMMERDVTLID